MNGTLKTVLIIGGVGVGVFLVLRALAPRPAPPRAGAGSSAVALASGLLPAAGNFFSNLFSSPPPIQSTSGGFVISADEQTHIDEYNAQGDVFGIAGIDY